jgi:SAM-dependent methyltransferase
MADADYVNLFIARSFVAPDTVALCIDVELPLPFLDESFDGLFCLDGLHYVRSKVALLREVDRIIGPEGAWLFAHMHNANGANINPGTPLTAVGYANRFAFGQQRLLPEVDILSQFQSDGFLDLTYQRAASVLDSSDALSLMGARGENLWRPHPFLDQALSRRPDLLALNPLYRLEQADDGFVARAAWPSESLQRECARTVPLFCDPVYLRYHTLQEIAVARASGTLSDEVRRLIRSFVLVCLPECYPRSDLSVH